MCHIKELFRKKCREKQLLIPEMCRKWEKKLPVGGIFSAGLTPNGRIGGIFFGEKQMHNTGMRCVSPKGGADDRP